MPELSRFLGIVIAIYFKDHNPPHFHALYNDYDAIFSIDSLAIIEGSLPPRIIGFVVEWATLHKSELMENWLSIQNTGKYSKIEPLV